jgi:hypothetical protein
MNQLEREVCARLGLRLPNTRWRLRERKTYTSS